MPGLDEDGQRGLRAHDNVFGGSACSPTRTLVEGPRPDRDPLADVYVLEDPDSYYAQFSTWNTAPLLLTPSQAKLHYGAQLHEFWKGMTRDTTILGALAVIGCSLPPGDPYAKQVLHQLSDGHSYALDHPGSCPWPQSRIKVIDYRTNENERREFLKTYRFLDRKHTDFEFGGLTPSSTQEIFASS